MENNNGHEITNSGFKDVLQGAEVFKMLQISQDTFKNPSEVAKLREVAQFVNNYSDGVNLLGHILRRNKSTMSPLDYVTGYAKLQSEKQEASKKLKYLEQEISLYE